MIFYFKIIKSSYLFKYISTYYVEIHILNVSCFHVRTTYNSNQNNRDNNDINLVSVDIKKSDEN